MRRQRTVAGCLVHAVVAVAIAGGGVLSIAGPIGAASGPGTTSTTTTTTAPVGFASLFVMFSPGGGFSIGSGSTSAAANPFGAAPSLRPLGGRTAAGGVVLRVYEGPLRMSLPSGLPGFPAASCLPDREVLVDASSPAVAATVAFYGRTGQQASPQGSYVGQAEGAPAAVVAAQVPSGTRQAVVHFDGGPTDRAAPLAGGWVVLAARVKAPPLAQGPGAALPLSPTLGTMTTIDRAGHTHPLGAVRAAIGYAIPNSCLPRPGGSTGTQPLTPAPIPLPKATGPPPANSAAARQAIETTFHRFYESPAGTQTGLLENEPALSEIIKEVQAAPLTQQYAGKTKLRIDDLQFLDRTHAALRIALLYNGQPLISNDIVRAILDHGRWKVALSTYCNLASMVGVTC
jgi:hypothetical protein